MNVFYMYLANKRLFHYTSWNKTFQEDVYLSEIFIYLFIAVALRPNASHGFLIYEVS